MLNRLKHLKNAVVLGCIGGLNFGCAIAGCVLAFAELMNATSKKPVAKTYTIDVSAKDIPKTTEKENEDNA